MNLRNVLMYVIGGLITTCLLERMWSILGTRKVRGGKYMQIESGRINFYWVLAFVCCMTGKQAQAAWNLWLLLFAAVVLVSRNYEMSELQQLGWLAAIYLSLAALETVGWIYARMNDSLYALLQMGMAEYLMALLLGGIRISRKNVKVQLFYWMMILFVPALSFFMVMLLLRAAGMGVWEKSAGLLGMLALNVIVIVMFNKLNAYYEDVLRKNIIEKQNLHYEKQLEDMSAAYREIRSVRHDIKNNMIVVSSLLEQDKKEEVFSYVNKIISMKGFSLDFVNTGHIAIDSLLNFKFHEIKEKGIRLEYSLQLSNPVTINGFDMAVILGNFLDNAIEAGEKEPEAFISVTLSDAKGSLKVVVENSCNKNLQVDGKVESTKKDKVLHGIGLSNVRQVVKKYNGEMFLKANQGVFFASALLYTD